jgi:hypothetical protein
MSNELYQDEKARFARVPKGGSVILTNASTLGTLYVYNAAHWKTVYTCGAHGGYVDCLYITTDETVSRGTHIAIYDPITGLFEHINTFTATLGAGTNATTQPINVLGNTVADAMPSAVSGKKNVRMEPGQMLVTTPTQAITAGKSIQVTAKALEFPAP